MRKVVEVQRHILRVKCIAQRSIVYFSALYHLWRYAQGITPSDGVKVKRPPVAGENLTYNQS